MLYTCIKSLKMCIKSDFKDIILKLANISSCPQRVVCPFPGAIYMYKSIKIHNQDQVSGERFQDHWSSGFIFLL